MTRRRPPRITGTHIRIALAYAAWALASFAAFAWLLEACT